MFPAIRFVLAVSGILLFNLPGEVSAGKNGPNKEIAKLCQKGGWQFLVGETGEVFSTEEECVSYGAQGGRLLNETEALCLFDGYRSLATSDGDPFSGSEECLDYVASGSTLVLCDLVGTAGVDTFGSVGIGKTACGFGGNDSASTVQGIFYGGEGNDYVCNLSNVCGGLTGVFNGGAGDDWILGDMTGGTFNGGAGDDRTQCRKVTYQNGIYSESLPTDLDLVIRTICNADQLSEFVNGTFNGEAGNDSVTLLNGGTFNGGDGNDITTVVLSGIFNGNEGDDRAGYLGRIWCDPFTEICPTPPSTAPVFSGGPGSDVLDGVDPVFFGTAMFNGGTGNDFVGGVPIVVAGSRVSLDGGEDNDTVGFVNCSDPPTLVNFENNPCAP